MGFRFLIKLVFVLVGVGIVAATYGHRILFFLETGHMPAEQTCITKAAEALDAGERGATPDDQQGCWSTITDAPPQVLTDTPPEVVNDKPPEVLN